MLDPHSGRTTDPVDLGHQKTRYATVGIRWTFDTEVDLSGRSGAAAVKITTPIPASDKTNNTTATEIDTEATNSGHLSSELRRLRRGDIDTTTVTETNIEIDTKANKFQDRRSSEGKICEGNHEGKEDHRRPRVLAKGRRNRQQRSGVDSRRQHRSGHQYRAGGDCRSKHQQPYLHRNKTEKEDPCHCKSKPKKEICTKETITNPEETTWAKAQKRGRGCTETGGKNIEAATCQELQQTLPRQQEVGRRVAGRNHQGEENRTHARTKALRKNHQGKSTEVWSKGERDRQEESTKVGSKEYHQRKSTEEKTEARGAPRPGTLAGGE